MDLDILQQILNKLTSLEQGQAKLEQGQAETNQRLTKLESDVDGIKTDVAEVKERVILMENENKRRFGALFDGHKLVYDKLEPIPASVEKLQNDVSVIKAVTISHSKEINTIKTVV